MDSVAVFGRRPKISILKQETLHEKVISLELAVKGFSPSELAGMRLRGLFERRGFRRVRVNKFEDYALYVDNKNFLQSESVITFMDSDGKLLALKPDVTLSIVRGAPKAELPALEKLYYVDEVCRLARESREYKMLGQIGVEIIGRADGFANIEAVGLALDSLSIISENFVLDVSHLGFVSGLIERMELDQAAKIRVMGGIYSKSPHDVASALDSAGVSDSDRARALKLCGLHGNFLEVLPEAKELIVCDQMAEAWAELERLGSALCKNGAAKRLKLDFSVVNDLDYYNGLIFLGYAEGMPKAVLTGGRYDNLMRKMGKKNDAIGFAVFLDELNTYFKSEKRFDFDALVTYPADCDYAALLEAAGTLSEQGASVRLESETSDLNAAGFTWGRRYRFENSVLREVPSC